MLKNFVEDFAKSMEIIDKTLPPAVNVKTKKPYQRGIGPYQEKLLVKHVTDDMKKFAEESGVIFMCVSEEKGHWGSFALEDNFDPKKLVPKIVCPNVGVYSECLYGFLYDGKEVDVEFTGDTIGKTRTFYLIEPTLDDSGLITYDIAEDWYM